MKIKNSQLFLHVADEHFAQILLPRQVFIRNFSNTSKSLTLILQGFISIYLMLHSNVQLFFFGLVKFPEQALLKEFHSYRRYHHFISPLSDMFQSTEADELVYSAQDMY